MSGKVIGVGSQRLKLLPPLESCVLASKKMRRALNVGVSLLVGLALLIPLDCFAASDRRPDKMACCLKGKCEPKAKSADCCKTGAPDRDQVGPQPTDHRPALNVLSVVAVLPVDSPLINHTSLGEPVKHPPPKLDSISAGLPLLI
jgi:hypothetical protein